jgi:hypothetical protein
MKLHQQKMTIDMEMETITDIRNIEIIDMKTCMDMKTDMVETRTCCDHFPTSLQGHRTVSSLGLDFINIITKSKPPGREGNRLINIVCFAWCQFCNSFPCHVHFTVYVNVFFPCPCPFHCLCPCLCTYDCSVHVHAHVHVIVEALVHFMYLLVYFWVWKLQRWKTITWFMFYIFKYCGNDL